MPREIHWTQSIAARLTAMGLVFLALVAALIATALFLLSAVENDAARADVLTQGRYRSYKILLDAKGLSEATGERRAALVGSIREEMGGMDRRFAALRDGDASLGLEPPDDPAVTAGIRAREDEWKKDVVPDLERLMAGAPGEDMAALLTRTRADIDRHIELIQAANAAGRDATEDDVARYRVILFVLGGATLVLVGAILFLARGLSQRIRALQTVTERFADGALDAAASVAGTDEIAALGESVNTMVAALRKNIADEGGARKKVETALASIADVVGRLGSASAEVVAATAQQASSIQEQTSAVAQTVATIDQIAATAQQAAERSSQVADAARRSEESTRAGQKAVADSVGAMESIRGQMDTVARSILALAERGQAIGEITSAINEIAEQSHVLALNAAIEASRAGDQGRGFVVVAGEVKALAEQSKKATSQVRQILGEIQGSTNAAVMQSEEGIKGAQAAAALVARAGGTIDGLTEEVTGAARIASQTVASAGQQATGMVQIRQAMRSIQEATQQNLAATRQTERAAQELGNLGVQLGAILTSYGR